MAFQIKRKPGTVKQTFQKDGKNLGTQINPKPRAPGPGSDGGVSGDQQKPTQRKWGQGSSSSQIMYDPENKQEAPVATVVNVKKFTDKDNGILDWVSDPNNVYIGRDMAQHVKGAEGSKWGNTYGDEKWTRERRVEQYEALIRRTPHLYDSLDELKGKCLGCWCAPELCHGHALVKLLEEKLKNKS